MTIKAILFDLDGTLFDTLPDIVSAINQMRRQYQLDDIPASLVRPIANLGAGAMIKQAFNINEKHPEYKSKREKLLEIYEQNIAQKTRLFNNVDKVLNQLNTSKIPWGIVTNRYVKHTQALLQAIPLKHKPQIIVCGDTLDKAKPHPEPILHACKSIKTPPENCFFVGDAITDVQASYAAGSKCLVALYGYIGEDVDPRSWKAHGYIQQPLDILNWL